MKILITGCAGFIGSKLAERLIENNHEVVGVDNLTTGSKENLSKIENDKRFKFYEMDVRSIEFKYILNGVDMIIHLAALKIPRFGNTLSVLMSNTMGTHNVLSLNIIEKGVPVIMASTSDVYGKGPVPFSEGNDLVLGSPDHRRWAYAVSKLFDEHLIMGYNEEYGMKYNIVRFFNVYGDHCALDWTGGAIPQMIGSIALGDPLKIHGDGKQTRCFCYIDDIIDGLMAIIEGGEWNNILNVGNDEKTSVNFLANLIIEMMRPGPGSVNIEYEDYKEFFGKYEDCRERVPDLSRMKGLYGWEPKVSLGEGLKKTIKWQLKVMKERGII